MAVTNARAAPTHGGTRLLAVIAAVVWAAAATWTPLAAGEAQPTASAVRSLYEARTHNVVLQDWDLSCGAAALATILRYQYGEQITEREVALGLIDRPAYHENPELIRARRGFSLLDMRRYLAELGYEGVGLGQMGFRDLVERAPVIVPVELQGYPHFVIFRGATDARVLVADPAFGNVTLSRADFEAAWIDYGDIGNVAFQVERDGERAPPGELAPTPREFVLLH